MPTEHELAREESRARIIKSSRTLAEANIDLALATREQIKLLVSGCVPEFNDGSLDDMHKHVLELRVLASEERFAWVAAGASIQKADGMSVWYYRDREYSSRSCGSNAERSIELQNALEKIEEGLAEAIALI